MMMCWTSKKLVINNPDTSVMELDKAEYKRRVDYTAAAECDLITGLPGVDFGVVGSTSI